MVAGRSSSGTVGPGRTGTKGLVTEGTPEENGTSEVAGADTLAAARAAAKADNWAVNADNLMLRASTSAPTPATEALPAAPKPLQAAVACCMPASRSAHVWVKTVPR